MSSILLVIASIVFIVLATIKAKVHPFLSLFTAALLVGIAAGIPIDQLIDLLSKGFGGTLSKIGFIIALGALIGSFLEKTKGTEVIVAYLLKWFGVKRSVLAMNLTGFIVSIPVFCDSAFVILSSINKTLSKKTKISLGVFAVALATGLFAAHVFVPPTPGPLAAAALLGANLGLLLIWGLIIGLIASLAGYLWAKKWSTKETYKEQKETEVIKEKDLKLSLGVFIPILLPIVLIGLQSVAVYPTHPFGEEGLFNLINAIGNPIIALFIGLIVAYLQSINKSKEQFQWSIEALKDAGIIILITGAGGAFGTILKELDIASLLNFQSESGIGGLLIAFVFAAILKSAQGSSTVAIVTTSAFVAPLLTAFGLDSELGKVFAVLAIGSGAMTISHINDSYFWVVSQFSDMDVKTALRSYSLGTLFQGIVSLAFVILIYLLIH
jgi:GntP family gluconate:H+ symporter